VTKPIPEEIKDYISYDPETGVCVWKKTTNQSIRVGDIVGGTQTNGYRVVRFRKELYKLHRVIWFLYHGEQPGDKEVDHINGDRSDNRISNLRLVTNQENQHNRTVLGITRRKETGKWEAQIYIGGSRKHLGYFDCPLLAGLAYHDAKRQLHPTAVRGLT
jgi:hypothetical protein